MAEHFKVKESLVVNWNSSFGWKERIAELENRTKADEFRDRAMDLVILLLESLTRPDEANSQKMVLTSSAKTTAETVKLAVDAFRKLREDAREEGSGGRTGGERRVKPNFNVNVIIKNA